jgi:hypothetical protein
MSTGVVSVSRRIAAPADRIFAVLADPRRHIDMDGSDMVRGSDDPAVTGVGDVFTTRMVSETLGGAYLMRNHVTEFDPDRCIAWRPAPGDELPTRGGAFPLDVPVGHEWRFDLVPDGPEATVVTETYACTDAPQRLRDAVGEGELWAGAMADTLARLDKLCTT